MTEAIDFSSGLAAEKEAVVQTAPTVPFWSENLLFAAHDANSGLGLWLHLGTEPTDWRLWEDRVFIALPGEEGVLSMWAFHETAPERRPAGSNLAFRCIEPFRRWRVTFDGYAQHSSRAAMAEGLAPDGVRRRIVIDLDVVAATPVWDAHSSATGALGQGGMDKQGWAKEHYEQLFRATGTIALDGAEARPVDATGWRDHSRGPRGGSSGDAWGGHVIAGCLFPSGRGLIFSRYWRPDGVLNLEGGCVINPGGQYRPARVVDAPRLTALQLEGERLPFALEWDGGAVALAITTVQSVWISMPKRVLVGRDTRDRGLMYVLNWGPCEWDGEIGTAYVERSDALNALPDVIGPAA